VFEGRRVFDVRMLPGRGGIWLGIDGERNEVIGAGDRDGAFEFYFLCFYEDLGGGVRKNWDVL